jgi:REP element-mobilizing transposase RayT
MRQEVFQFRTWGGKRPGAGRKPTGVRPGVSHVTRPKHDRRCPVHVTLRAARGVPSLRKQAIFVDIRRAIGRASRESFRIVHFSVQSDHVHLLVEADDKLSLSRGTSGLVIRVARAVNRRLRRRGRLWSDRFHARELRTPREVRHVIAYVLMNFKKHGFAGANVDDRSSAYWLDGWRTPPLLPPPLGWSSEYRPPVHLPKTWLAAIGWRRHGLIDPKERPGRTDPGVPAAASV